jgi:hypothetical protein
METNVLMRTAEEMIHAEISKKTTEVIRWGIL